MNLFEFKMAVINAEKRAIECGYDPEHVTVSMQIGTKDTDVWGSTNIGVIFDCDTLASGCVVIGDTDD